MLMSFATYGLLNCSNLITIKTVCMGGGGYLVACPTNLYGRSFFFKISNIISAKFVPPVMKREQLLDALKLLL